MSDPQPKARKTGLIIGVLVVLAFLFLVVTMFGACNESGVEEERIAPDGSTALVVPLPHVA
jgi:hypothetical protein